MIKVILVKENCEEALEDKENLLKEQTATKKAKIVKKAHIAILLSLAYEVLRKVAHETTAVGLWNKLESTY